MNPVLLIAIPLGLGFLSVFVKKLARVFLYLGAIFNVSSLVFYEIDKYYAIGGFEGPYGISLLLDNYSFVALFFLNTLFLLMLIINVDKVKELAIVLLIALAGLNGLLLTNDLFNLFVFIEISGIAAYLITTQNKKILYSFHYMVIGTVGSSFYLLGLAMLYNNTGTLNMTHLKEKLTTSITATDIAFPVLLMFIGLAVEAKLLPFSSWVKGILQHATSFVGVLIGSIYAGVMLFVFGRLFTDVFVLNDTLVQIIVVLGMFTLIAAEFAAFSSKKLREILLFSSIAQAGLVVVLFTYDLKMIAMLLIISNILSKFIMFTIAGRISENEDDDIDNLRGIFAKHKFIGFSYSVASLSLAGLPLFYGFIVKLNLLYNLFLNSYYLVTGLILLTSVVEGAYLIRVLVQLWTKGEEGEYASTNDIKTKFTTRPIVTVVVLLMALVILVLGVTPDYNHFVFTSNESLESVNPIRIIEELGGLMK